MSITEQGIIRSADDIYRLNIIDFNRLNGYWRHQGEAMDTILSWFRDAALYSIHEISLWGWPEAVAFPGWKHVGSHEELGQLFWNWFTCVFPNSSLSFGDEPDFFIKFNERELEWRAWGDIGVVSASTFAITQKGLMRGDLWISVLDYDTQVLIEPLYDIQATFADKIANYHSRFET